MDAQRADVTKLSHFVEHVRIKTLRSKKCLAFGPAHLTLGKRRVFFFARPILLQPPRYSQKLSAKAIRGFSPLKNAGQDARDSASRTSDAWLLL